MARHGCGVALRQGAERASLRARRSIDAGRLGLAACVATVALGWVCSPASAFTFDLAEGHVSVVAAVGEVNAFAVEDLAGGVIVTDLAGNPVSSVVAAGCAVGPAWEVVCQPGVVSSLTVDAGDGDDSVSNGSVLARVTLLGGAGNDRISGGGASERLFGGSGNDAIQGGDGDDIVDGGDGADELIGVTGTT